MTCLPHVLLVTVALAGMACSATAADSATGELVWFGTYTRGKSGSEGIYVARFDAASGELSPPVLAAAATNPSFLADHPTRPILYAVAEVANEAGNPTGSVTGFAIDEATGSLTSLGSQPSGGGGPCHWLNISNVFVVAIYCPSSSAGARGSAKIAMLLLAAARLE